MKKCKLSIKRMSEIMEMATIFEFNTYVVYDSVVIEVDQSSPYYKAIVQYLKIKEYHFIAKTPNTLIIDDLK